MFRTLLGGLALLVVLVAAGCGGTSEDSASGASGDGGGGKLTLVAYSTPEEAYRELIPAFNKTPEGEGVGFDQSYASSGEQSRAVEGGLPADVVEFSLEPDITRLVEAGLVEENWNQNEHKGMLTDSVVVFMVRKGNPKNIQDWDDLVTGEVEVIEPNPFTSGGAKWNIMAAYGAQLEQGKSPEEAQAVPRRPVRQRAGARQERPRVAPDVLGRQGRRAARLRERGDPRPEERRGARLHRARTRRS